MRVALRVRRRDAHAGQRVQPALLARGAVEAAGDLQRLTHTGQHPLARVERGMRVLEHVLVVAPVLAQRAGL